MIIDFETIEENIAPAFFGGEKEYRSRMFVDEYGKIVQGRLIPGASIGLHTHEVNYEVMYFLEGEASILYNGEKLTVKPGQVHYCPKGQSHTILNEGSEDVVFFAVLPNAP
ncbi:MAG: cupin domain-containing protein [Methanocorpusculum parvum]|nr:cupin domain-containing protein [Methanocorpusculum parvum]